MRGIEQIPWLYEIVCGLLETTGGLAHWRRQLVGGALGRLMDLGSGTGRNLALLPQGTDVVAVDPSIDALEWGRRRAPGALRVVARAESLPFRDATFDTVLSGLVFCSVAAPDRALREVRRVLRREGRLRMLEHVRSRIPWRARVQDAIQPFWTSASGGCHPNRDTEATVERAGFLIQPDGRRARGVNRLFSATPASRR